MNSSSPASSPLPLDDRPPNFDDALLDPVMQSSLGLGDLPLVGGQLELPDPLSRGSPSSIDAEPDLENDDTDSPFYQPDGEGSDDYDLGQDFSQDSVRLRNAVFKRDGSPEEEDPADVLMTPVESELDETDSAPYEMSDDPPVVGSKGAEA